MSWLLPQADGKRILRRGAGGKLSISTIGAAVNGDGRPGGASPNGRGLFVGAVLGAVVVGFLLYRVNPGRRPKE
jgi:hypothetical protein